MMGGAVRVRRGAGSRSGRAVGGRAGCGLRLQGGSPLAGAPDQATAQSFVCQGGRISLWRMYFVSCSISPMHKGWEDRALSCSSKVPACDPCWLRGSGGLSQVYHKLWPRAQVCTRIEESVSIYWVSTTCQAPPQAQGTQRCQECQGPCPHPAHTPVGGMQTWYRSVHVVNTVRGPCCLLGALEAILLPPSCPISPHPSPAPSSLSRKAPGRPMFPPP